MRKFAHIAWALFIVAWSGAAFAQAGALQLRAEVSDATVSVGQQFVFSLTATTSDPGASMGDPQLPDFGGLTVVRQMPVVRQSSTQGFGNQRQTTVSLSLRAVLVAPREGTYTIGPGSIVFDGQRYESNSNTITAKKPDSASLPASLRDSDILPAQTSSPALTRQLDGRLFMLGSVDNTAPYEGQPIKVTYTVYTDIEPQSAAIDSYLRPETGGLPGNDFEFVYALNLASARGRSRRGLPAELATIDGETFRAIRVLEAFAIPVKPGQYSLGPYSIVADLPVRRSNDPFGFPSIFDDPTARALLPTAPVTITVKPLPEGGGAAQQRLTGDFEISAHLDRQQMSQDELATLRLRIEGHGNVLAIPEPDLPEMEAFDIYDSHSEELPPAETPEGLQGGREFEFVLRARRSGQLEIPPISMLAFNPWSEEYETLSTPSIPIEVDPPADAPEVFAAVSGQPIAGTGVSAVSEGFAYIETDGFRPNTARMKAYQDPLIWAVQAIPLVLLGGAFGWRRRRDWASRNARGVRRRGARSAAGRRLRKAASLCRASHAEAFHAALSAALRGFFGDKLGRSSAGLQVDELREELIRAGVEEAMAHHAAAILEETESARFAPGAGEEAQMRAVLERARALIETMHRKL